MHQDKGGHWSSSKSLHPDSLPRLSAAGLAGRSRIIRRQERVGEEAPGSFGLSCQVMLHQRRQLAPPNVAQHHASGLQEYYKQQAHSPVNNIPSLAPRLPCTSATWNESSVYESGHTHSVQTYMRGSMLRAVPCLAFVLPLHSFSRLALVYLLYCLAHLQIRSPKGVSLHVLIQFRAKFHPVEHRVARDVRRGA